MTSTVTFNFCGTSAKMRQSQQAPKAKAKEAASKPSEASQLSPEAQKALEQALNSREPSMEKMPRVDTSQGCLVECPCEGKELTDEQKESINDHIESRLGQNGVTPLPSVTIEEGEANPKDSEPVDQETKDFVNEWLLKDFARRGVEQMPRVKGKK